MLCRLLIGRLPVFSIQNTCSFTITDKMTSYITLPVRELLLLMVVFSPLSK